MPTPEAMTDDELIEGFAPCPTCGQYSHSIGEMAEAHLHFETMIAHPARGHAMGHAFDDQTRDMAQMLIADNARLRADNEAMRAANANLRSHIAGFANNVNIAGSAYDDAIKAMDRLVAETKSSARAALTSITDPTNGR